MVRLHRRGDPFDAVRASRRSSSSVTPSHSLLSMEPSGTHGDTLLDTPLLRRSGLTAKKCETEIRPHLSRRTFWSKSNERSMRWWLLPTSTASMRFMLLHLSKAENENLKNKNSISQISILFQRVGCIQQFPKSDAQQRDTSNFSIVVVLALEHFRAGSLIVCGGARVFGL